MDKLLPPKGWKLVLVKSIYDCEPFEGYLTPTGCIMVTVQYATGLGWMKCCNPNEVKTIEKYLD